MLGQLARLAARSQHGALYSAEAITGCCCTSAQARALPSTSAHFSCSRSKSSSSTSDPAGPRGSDASGSDSTSGSDSSSGSSLFSEYIDPDYKIVHDLDAQTFQGNKRVTKAQKAAVRALTKGPERTLRHELVPVPPDVQVLCRGSRLYFSGPLGVNAIDLQKLDSEGMTAFRVDPVEGGGCEIRVAGPSSSFVGTISSLIRNKVTGVVQGYLIYLQLVGVGYRVTKETKDVTYTVAKR